MESGESPTDAKSPEEISRFLFLRRSPLCGLFLSTTHFALVSLTRHTASNPNLWIIRQRLVNVSIIPAFPAIRGHVQFEMNAVFFVLRFYLYFHWNETVWRAQR